MAEFARTFVLSMGGGSTREIASAEEAGAEIAAGALRRDTLVVVYEGGRGRSLRAGDAPELQPLFDAAGAATPPRAPQLPDAAPVVPLTSDAAEPSGATPVESPPATLKPEAQPPAAPPPVTRRKGLGCAGTLLVWGLALAAAAWLLTQCAGGGFLRTDTAYVTRPTTLRAGPSVAAPARGGLPRGAEVRGRADARDHDWFRVSAGRGRGGWLWRRNLSARRRPALTGDPAPRRAPAPAVLRAEPEGSAPAVGRIARGEPLNAAGVTAEGWAELRLPGGGVGYLRVEDDR